MNTTKQKPPPKTVIGKAIIKNTRNSQMIVEIYVDILPDKKDSTIKGAHTSFKPIGKLPDGHGGTHFYKTPGYSWVNKGRLKIIKSLEGLVEVKGTIKIQTVYAPSASSTVQSAYGRGTTPEDESVGNTSLGFHESCHRNDYLKYLKNTAIPTFSGRVGMTEQQYTQAATLFNTAINKYFDDMGGFSIRNTDEVGYKKSTYKTKGERP